VTYTQFRTYRFATTQNVTDDRQTTQCTKGTTDSTVGQKTQYVTAACNIAAFSAAPIKRIQRIQGIVRSADIHTTARYSKICWSVCVRLYVCRKVYCGKTAEWIRMPFGIVSGVSRMMGVLDGVVIVLWVFGATIKFCPYQTVLPGLT